MRKIRVLLIDDEVTFTELLKVNLEEAGPYEVAIENRGTQALATARAVKPDIIFLDVIMPDLDGSRIAAQLVTDPALKHTPIVYVTAILSKRDAQTSPRALGGVGCIAKPVGTKEIVACIEQHAARPVPAAAGTATPPDEKGGNRPWATDTASAS